MKKIIWIVLLSLIIILPSIPQTTHKNKGISKSVGKVHNGSLQNSYQLDWSRKNTIFFSKFSYYILGRAYVHSKVYNTIYQAHDELYKLLPKRKFFIMECSRRKGGRMYPHRTHQNGLSVDFFTPLKKNGKQKNFKGLGVFRYFLNFDKHGKRKDTEIDFNIMAKHILILEKHARKNKLRIKKVIFKIDLKGELFASEYGKTLRNNGIYFAKNLSPTLNKLHDDHYHIDFEILE